MKRTKIVCTIGPASKSPAVLKKMMKAGMNVARLNFSHGTYPQHADLIKNIRQAAKDTGTVIALLQDLQGPRIRLGNLPDEGVKVGKGEKVTFTTEARPRKGHIPVTYNKLHKELKKGHRILVADGVFEFVVERIQDRMIICKAQTAAQLSSHKGMNLPDSTLSISSLSEKDIADLEFGIKHKVDFVALSFVRTAADVSALKRLITQFEKKHKITEATPPKVIVKVEKPEAVKNFEEILAVCDGVMIARGDLGIEMDAHDVPLLQKKMIARCNEVAKPVIVATQMLESMIVSPRPTRAEISDVANAVIDHTDAVMLSGETAMGKYPVEAVRYMAQTAEEIEASSYDDVAAPSTLKKYFEDEAMASAVKILSAKPHVTAIVVASRSGSTARLIAKYRPEIPVVVATDSARVQRQLSLSWGVVPVHAPRTTDIEKLSRQALAAMKQMKLVRTGDIVIVVKGNALSRHSYPLAANQQQLSGIELLTV